MSRLVVDRGVRDGEQLGPVTKPWCKVRGYHALVIDLEEVDERGMAPFSNHGFHQSRNMGSSTVFQGLEIEGLEERGSMRRAWDDVGDTRRFLLNYFQLLQMSF